MKKYSTGQKGFTAIEGLLIILILAIIGGTGYFVWHSKQQTDKTLNTSTQVSQTQASSETKKFPDDVEYNPAVEISAKTDVSKLTGTTQEFKDFVADEYTTFSSGEGASACVPAAISIDRVVQQRFSLGDVATCNGDELLWVLTDGKWQRVAEVERGFGCETIEKYKISKLLVSNCINSDLMIIENTNP